MSLSVLVVDDEEDVRGVLRVMFEFMGFSVHEACDGIDALEQVSYRKPDAIILDMMMPKMDGLEVCEALNQSESQNIPIIMLSADSDSETVANCIKAGARKYLCKPIELDTLLKSVQQVLPTAAHISA